MTRRGVVAAVLVPPGQWQNLTRGGKPMLKELLLTDLGRADLLIPAQGRMSRRRPVAK